MSAPPPPAAAPAATAPVSAPAEPPRTACRDAARQLAVCVEAHSPCVRAGGSILDCLKAKDTEACTPLRSAYFECRRSQLDMRTRIRGRKFSDYGDSTT